MVKQIQVIYFATMIPIIASYWVLTKINTYTAYLYIFYVFGCFLSYLLTCKLIPVFKPYNLKADLFGMDINKKGTEMGEKKVPESMGMVPAVIFMIIGCLGTILIQQIHKDIMQEHLASLLSISFIIFLGFADDVLDLPWRYKLILPIIASMPILTAYNGSTNIIIPKPFIFILGGNLELGLLYYIYMSLLSVFCTNAINIYAGINGLEIGQSLIISISIVLHNMYEIYNNNNTHTISLIIMIPYFFNTLALFKYNKYPSQVFVGDVFCYWSGVCFAVCGILGHFSKTLLLFFIPQIINFIYSLPQLFKIIPCPRHRLPKYNIQTGLLEDSKNLTLINLYLKIFGPTGEESLCTRLLIFQIICCILGFFIRYELSKFFY